MNKLEVDVVSAMEMLPTVKIQDRVSTFVSTMETIDAEIAYRSEDSYMFLITRGIEYVYVHLDNGSETHGWPAASRAVWMAAHKPKFLQE